MAPRSGKGGKCAMKRRIAARRSGIFLAALFLLPLAANVYSAKAAEIHLMTVPLYCSGGNAISQIFSSVPEGTVFYLWDSNLQAFSTASKGNKGIWTGGSRQVLPGEGFFHQPAGLFAPVVFTGNAPTSPVTITVSAKPTLLGYPLNSSIVWTDTALADALPVGSIVSFCNSTGSWHKAFLKAPATKGGGWGSVATNFVVGPYDGFAVRQPPGSTTLPWTE